MTNVSELFNRHLIGFDDIFSRVERGVNSKLSYPPYDIIKVSPEMTRVDIAVAGFAKSDLSVTVEDNTLCVCGNKAEQHAQDHIHKGISYRSWSKRWTLNKQLEVQVVRLVDGILSIEMVHKVPEDKKPLQIEIQ